MEICVIATISFAAGYTVRALLAGVRALRLEREQEAPTPDYDVNNPINGKGHRGEIVNVCGADMVRMN